MRPAPRRFGPAGSFLFLALGAAGAAGQSARPAPAGQDTAVVAGARYQAGGFHQWFLGHNYRDLWTARVTVPVLDLHAFAGGLRPLKSGGGLQTKSLRFSTADGSEWVFRSVDKSVHLPSRFKGTIIEQVFRDQISAAFPASGVMVAPLLEAGGVFHATPTIVFMPDDSLLGEFRKDYAGLLGTIEEYPSKPEHGNGFAGALEIIDSDSLLKLLNRNPTEWVDARALLTARLLDLLVNDPDRHPGQWKWLRTADNPPGPWMALPRDRDQAFISYEGFLVRAVRQSRPNLVAYNTVINVPALTYNSLDTDRRLLGALEKPVWDSVVGALVGRLSDQVIDSAFAGLPEPYRVHLPVFVSVLKQRRDNLPATAQVYYRLLADRVDIHGTDASDRVTVTRIADGGVSVRLGKGPGTFSRRYDPAETSEIRIYLHGGDDSAVVTGHATRSIPIWVLGGNGTNWLVDSSTVASHGDRARLYDAGQVKGVSYGPDTLFNRRPWPRDGGKIVFPFRDRGSRTGLGGNVHSDRGLGPVPRISVFGYRYGMGRRPYARRLELGLEYAINVDRVAGDVIIDQRLERTPFHVVALARMTGFELINYHGLGNNTPGTPADLFKLRQQQWLFQPAVALALSTRSDLSFGPVLKYSTVNAAKSPFLAAHPQYGSGHFGEAGLRLGLNHESSDRLRNPNFKLRLDLAGTYFPALWDVTSGFGRVSGTVGALVRVPVPTHPMVVTRFGGAKLYGDFPFHEAAFIGGGNTVRFMEAQRYAGDASLFATAELRVPVLGLSVLLPVDVGVLGIADAGRVYLKGSSPDGWHGSLAGGVWFGFPETRTIVTLTITNERGQSGIQLHSGLNF